jgi:hypothetical protein
VNRKPNPVRVLKTQNGYAILCFGIRDSLDKNQNPKDEWRREAPPLIFWV